MTSIRGTKNASATATAAQVPPEVSSSAAKPLINERLGKKSLSEPVMQRQVDRMDAFVDGDQATINAIVERLRKVAGGMSTGDLEAATRAMKICVVRKTFDPTGPINITEGLKTFSRLWAAAGQLERAAAQAGSAPTGVNLEFGFGFNAIVNYVNGKEISVTSRN
jgi:hypothetical protein